MVFEEAHPEEAGVSTTIWGRGFGGSPSGRGKGIQGHLGKGFARKLIPKGQAYPRPCLGGFFEDAYLEGAKASRTRTISGRGF